VKQILYQQYRKQCKIIGIFFFKEDLLFLAYRDQQQIKRIQKTNFSPYLTKVTLRPLPVILPKPTGVGYKIFKSKDPPNSTSTTTDLSNIILTPSSSSSLLDANDEQSTSTMHT
jgi:hypothetical protein